MKFNLFVALTIVALLTAWMLLGSACSGPKPETPETSADTPEKPIPSVRTRVSVAQDYVSELTLRGKTEEARSSLLKAEVGGSILEISAQRGSWVQKGEALIHIDPKSLPSQLEAAKALVEQRELEHEASLKLSSNGYQSEAHLARSKAQLTEARNQLATTEIMLANTVIRAPYDGVFNERLVDVGEFVAVGDPIAAFLELDPIVITAQATEQEVKDIQTGAEAIAIVGKHEHKGTVRYISQAADAEIRTYTVEVEIANADRNLRAGMTADLKLKTDSQSAHKVSPALLFLSANSDGDLGIKAVDEDNTVIFYKTEIIGSADDGVWVSGLPDSAQIITVGQGFVKPGLTVDPVDEASIR